MNEEEDFSQRVKILKSLGFEHISEQNYVRSDLTPDYLFYFGHVPTEDLQHTAVRFAFESGKWLGKIEALSDFISTSKETQ